MDMTNSTATETANPMTEVVVAMFAAVQARVDAGMTMTAAWTDFAADVQAECARLTEFDAWVESLGAAG